LENIGNVQVIHQRLDFSKNYSGEISKNRSGSHPDHENRLIIISTVLIRRGGASSGAVAFIHFQVYRGLPSVIPEGQFNMKMSSEFPVCVPVVAGIASVFRGNHSKQTDTTLDILSLLKAHFFNT
jgi:hypothetical protein